MEEIRDTALLLRTAALFAGGTASLALDVSEAVLPVSAAQMVHMAYELGSAADKDGVNNVDLLNAAKELSEADGNRRTEAVYGLIRACVAFAHDAGNDGHDGLMHSAIDLVLAGRCYLRVAALGGTEGPATAQPKHTLEEQPAGVGDAAWWSKWMRKMKVGDLEEHLLQESSPTRGNAADAFSSCSYQNKVQGKLCDRWLGMQVAALSMSLCLLPYMGRDGLLKSVDKFSSDYLWWVNLLFKMWWGSVALGVPCSLYGRWWIERQYARLSSHLGMLGLTVLVGMFSHWMLAAEATAVLTIFLIITIGLFIFSFIRCCVKGDL